MSNIDWDAEIAESNRILQALEESAEADAAEAFRKIEESTAPALAEWDREWAWFRSIESTIDWNATFWAQFEKTTAAVVAAYRAHGPKPSDTEP